MNDCATSEFRLVKEHWATKPISPHDSLIITLVRKSQNIRDGHSKIAQEESERDVTTKTKIRQ